MVVGLDGSKGSHISTKPNGPLDEDHAAGVTDEPEGREGMKRSILGL